jgi:hypothetical protein
MCKSLEEMMLVTQASSVFIFSRTAFNAVCVCLKSLSMPGGYTEEMIGEIENVCSQCRSEELHFDFCR